MTIRQQVSHRLISALGLVSQQTDTPPPNAVTSSKVTSVHQVKSSAKGPCSAHKNDSNLAHVTHVHRHNHEQIFFHPNTIKMPRSSSIRSSSKNRGNTSAAAAPTEAEENLVEIDGVWYRRA
jgi:hypothetical protein